MQSAFQLFFAFVLAASLLAVGRAGAEEPAEAVRVHFEGDSTLHAFTGEVQSTDLACARDAEGQEILHIRIPVKEMKTGHEGRDARMYKMFHADRFEFIEGEARRDLLVTGDAAVLPLRLTICDVTRDIRAERSVVAGEDPSLLRVSFEVSLKDFQLKAPSVAALIRVRDTVRVSVLLDAATLPRSAGPELPKDRFTP